MRTRDAVPSAWPRVAQPSQASQASQGTDRRTHTPVPTPQQVVLALELRRRQAVLRTVCIGLLVATLSLVPSSLVPVFNPPTLTATVLAMLGGALGLVLGARRLVPLAAYTVLGALTLAIALAIVGKALNQGGLDVADLRLYDLFLLPIGLSAIIVSRRGPVVLCFLTASFTFASMFLLPQTADMRAYWHSTYLISASPVDAVSVALVMQAMLATAAWLGADSAQRALRDATRADGLAEANSRILAQTREMEQKRRQLQAGIMHLQEVLAAAARGNWRMRARIDGGELMPLAVSLNLLLERLKSLSLKHSSSERSDTTAHALAEALRRLWHGEPYEPPPYTGGALDEVLIELAKLPSALYGARLAARRAAGSAEALPPPARATLLIAERARTEGASAGSGTSAPVVRGAPPPQRATGRASTVTADPTHAPAGASPPPAALAPPAVHWLYHLNSRE